jgi:hypothetical protein
LLLFCFAVYLRADIRAPDGIYTLLISGCPKSKLPDFDGHEVDDEYN